MSTENNMKHLNDLLPPIEKLDFSEELDQTEENSKLLMGVSENDSTPSSFKHDDEDADGWLDILGSGQLKKKVIKKGKEGTRPQRGTICFLKLEAKLDDGTVVESQDNLGIQLGDSEVIQGLDLAVPLMDVDEEAVVEVHPRFGYGTLGLAPTIPPEAQLTYIVHLLKTEPEPELEELSLVERKDIGNQKRERGNWWYSREQHSLAIQCYRRALEYLDEAEGGITTATANEQASSSEDLRQLLDDRLKVFNNLAAAQMKIKAYDTALQSVENVLRCQPKNVKALFRKGKILAEKGNSESALEALTLANQLEPDNKVIQQELSRVEAKNRQDKKKEKSLYRRMLGQDSTSNNTKSDTSTDSPSQPIKKNRVSLSLVLGSVAALVAGVVMYRLKPF